MSAPKRPREWPAFMIDLAEVARRHRPLVAAPSTITFTIREPAAVPKLVFLDVWQEAATAPERP